MISELFYGGTSSEESSVYQFLIDESENDIIDDICGGSSVRIQAAWKKPWRTKKETEVSPFVFESELIFE
jgi:hypothetical protein